MKTLTPEKYSEDYLTRFAALFYLNGIVGLKEKQLGITARSDDRSACMGDAMIKEIDSIIPRIEWGEEKKKGGPIIEVEVETIPALPALPSSTKRGRPSLKWQEIIDNLPKGEFTAKQIGVNKAVKLLSIGAIRVSRQIAPAGRGRPTNMLVKIG